jgi:hypothetical protein
MDVLAVQQQHYVEQGFASSSTAASLQLMVTSSCATSPASQPSSVNSSSGSNVVVSTGAHEWSVSKLQVATLCGVYTTSKSEGTIYIRYNTLY